MHKIVYAAYHSYYEHNEAIVFDTLRRRRKMQQLEKRKVNVATNDDWQQHRPVARMLHVQGHQLFVGGHSVQ